MKKYIDAEKLKTNIKRKIESIENCLIQLASLGEEKKSEGELAAYEDTLSIISFLQQETSEISLEEFIEKIEDWKARFSYPDSIPVKATIAFTARMFYMYPDVARQWYDSLSKATQD